MTHQLHQSSCWLLLCWFLTDKHPRAFWPEWVHVYLSSSLHAALPTCCSASDSQHKSSSMLVAACTIDKSHHDSLLVLASKQCHAASMLLGPWYCRNCSTPPPPPLTLYCVQQLWGFTPAHTPVWCKCGSHTLLLANAEHQLHYHLPVVF